MPAVRRVEKGDLEKAMSACGSREGKQQALDLLVDDMYATTSKRPRDALLKTWVKLHTSVTRGLAGARRSEAFDLCAVVKALEGVQANLADDGPVHPLAMVVCATYFMLRELEASAVDRSDVMFGEESVTLALPVSKTDWEAKGCSRTWSCICDRSLPCPFHILKEHCGQLDRQGRGADLPLFPDKHGNYCTKSGVVQTIRIAAQKTGMEVTDSEGGQRLSGHTFRITGARFLSAAGLDPITIQLLGRWGSNAVLTYLAESPLMSMKHRLKPLESQRLEQVRRDGPPAFGQMDARAHADEMFNLDKRLQDRMMLVEDRVNTLNQQLDQHADQLQGISIVLNSGTEETWKVINTKSRVEHRSDIQKISAPKRKQKNEETGVLGKAATRLKGSRFRWLNETLYTMTGDEALDLFSKDPSLAEAYHEGFRAQAAKWPRNPLDDVIRWLKEEVPRQHVIGDFGCGDARLALELKDRTVHSFDLVQINSRVTACNLAAVPLPKASLDVAIFCLALMGTDWTKFVAEARRCLKLGGLCHIVEVESRFADVEAVVRTIESLGFQQLMVKPGSFFVEMRFRATKKDAPPGRKSKGQDALLQACTYRKR
eukprot:s1409_g9.t1